MRSAMMTRRASTTPPTSVSSLNTIGCSTPFPAGSSGRTCEGEHQVRQEFERKEDKIFDTFLEERRARRNDVTVALGLTGPCVGSIVRIESARVT